MPIHTLEWRWAHGGGTGVDSRKPWRVGLVAAVRSSRTADTVVVYGVAPVLHLQALACSLDGSRWVPAQEQTAIPESTADRQTMLNRFRHKFPTQGKREGDLGELMPVSIRFACKLSNDSLLPTPGQTLQVASGTIWSVNLPIHCRGYPISESGNSTHLDLESSPNTLQANSARVGSVDPGVDVTVCVPYMYGRGYGRHTILEFTAWYLLLGARRVVMFESMEPELTVPSEKAVVKERVEALHALSRKLGDRLVVVRGLATWDVMRRTSMHMNGQTLASNMCKDAAGALAPHVSKAFALMLDLDEFLAPPPPTLVQSEQRPHERLAGSLERLARRVTNDQSAVSLRQGGAQAMLSRVHVGVGSGRCLSFASSYYLPPACSALNASDYASTVDSTSPLPTILWRSMRGQPDQFELGPSHAWTWVTRWDWRVRSKYMVDATDFMSLVGVHECCCRFTTRRVGGSGNPTSQCSTKHGLSKDHSCAALEFMPIEQWHVHHFRGKKLCQTNATHRAVRWTKSPTGVGKSAHVSVRAQDEPLPVAWANEYVDALHTLNAQNHRADHHQEE